MRIQERSSGAATVLELDGRLVLGDGSPQLLKDKVHSLVNQNRKHIILDLGRVAQIDSAGLGEIVVCCRPLRA